MKNILCIIDCCIIVHNLLFQTETEETLDSWQNEDDSERDNNDVLNLPIPDFAKKGECQKQLLDYINETFMC